MRHAVVLCLACEAFACGGGAKDEPIANDGSPPISDSAPATDGSPADVAAPDDGGPPADSRGTPNEGSLCGDIASQKHAPASIDASDGSATPGDAAGCPAPVDCTGDKEPYCRWPPPRLPSCTPIDEQFGLSFCDNGYMIFNHVYEGGNLVRQYFFDSKLIATFSGYRQARCTEGPPDFVEPECSATCYVDLCASGDASSSASARERASAATRASAE